MIGSILSAALLAGCTAGDSDEPPPPVVPTDLSLAVYGAPAEQQVWAEIVDVWNLDEPGREVTLTTFPDSRSLADSVAAGSEDTPDVFLLDRVDLARLVAAERVQPVGGLLDDEGRDVDLGDGYPLDAVNAFAADNDLQCLPYGYSPMVVYYNTDLINFSRMGRRGLDVPEDHEDWSFEQFSVAARFASRPARRSAGVHVEPTLEGLAPFIYSGGGEVFDDPEEPTSLAFSEDDSRAALTTTLELLRNPLVTLTEQQLAQRPALEWFKAGQLGMVTGFRGLTPELREVPGLHFDVMPMPSLGDDSTVGEVSGLCLSADARDPEAAADLIYYLAGEEPTSQVARAGYLVPASVQVAASQDFLQGDQMPVDGNVFTATMRDIVLFPPVQDLEALEAAVADDLAALLAPGVLDLEAVTAQVDADSVAVLQPDTESGSPSPTGSATP